MKLTIRTVLLALAISISFSQEKENDLFYFDALNFFSPDSTKTRLDVYAEIPFSRVEFKRDKLTDKFVSDFDLTLDIKDKDNMLVFNKVYKEEITTQKTDIEYLAQNSQIITKNIYLQPGEYKVRMSVYEQRTKKYSEKEKTVQVRDFLNEPLTLSDIMIVSKLNEVNGRKYITPGVSRNVGALDTFYLFFFVYRNSEQPSLDVKCKITNSKNEQVFSQNENVNITSGIDIQNRIFIAVPTNNFSIGKFKIEILASDSQFDVTENSSFDNEDVDFPIDLTNIDDAISQLQYIAKDSEIEHIENAKTDAEKRKRLIEFWNSKDPSPSTKRNEVLIEYYVRIKYADIHYSTPYTPGWKTDMGMVYIIFGLPNNIERHPYEMDTKPYEIWDYYDINRQFVFVDDSGFGDYRLVTPIWDRYNYR
jgi:GWxTD domain-containing protein